MILHEVGMVQPKIDQALVTVVWLDNDIYS